MDVKKKEIDWTITLVPLGIVVALSILFFVMPEQSNTILSQIRFFFELTVKHFQGVEPAEECDFLDRGQPAG